MNRIARLGIVLALAALAGGSLGAQSVAPRARVVPAVPVAGELAAYRRVVEDAMTVVLDRLGYDVVVAADAPDRPVSALEIGEQLRFEYAMLSLLPRIHMSLSVYDEAQDVHLITVTERARANVTLYNSVDTLVEAAALGVQSYLDLFAMRGEMVRPVALTSGLELPELDEDASITLQPRAPLPMDGSLLVAGDARIEATLQMPGRYDETIVFDPDTEVPRLTRKRRVGVQLHYSRPRLVGAGFGARYYLLPDRLHATGEFDFWLTGLTSEAPFTVIHLEPRLLFGVVALGGPRSLFQVELSSGPGLLTTVFTSGLVAPYLDLYWNVVNVRLNIQTGAVLWFARTGLSYAFASDRSFLGEGLDNPGWNPAITVGTMLRW